MASPGSENSPLPLAVLLSGSGRTLANLLRRIGEGELDARVVAVASDRDGVRGLEIARGAGLPTEVFARSEFSSRLERDAAMLRWVRSRGPQVICLAGYLSLLDLAETAGIPVLNIHPALLPAYGGKGYYGDRVHAAVLQHRERESGATVHLVDERFDEGSILARAVVPVEPGDDVHRLAARVFAAECELYPELLRWIAEGTLWFEGGEARGAEGPWEPRTLRPGIEPGK